MFCSQCGKEIPDGVAFCPNCGKQVNAAKSIDQAANDVLNAAEKEVNSAVNEVRSSFTNQNQNFNQGPINQGNTQPQPAFRPTLKTDRGLLSYLLLSIITCGIYDWFFVSSLASDLNTACAGDGEETAGLVKYILLCIVTCGIYSIIWKYSVANRLAANSQRYGLNFQENGTTVLLWSLFGSLICGIGPFIAMNIIIKNSNKICMAYNNSSF